MKNGSILSGILLIGLGFLFLGMQLDWFQISWFTILKYWPVLLIVLGLLMYTGKTDKTSATIILVLLGIAIPVALSYKLKNSVSSKINQIEKNIDFQDKDFDLQLDTDDDSNIDFQELNYPLENTITKSDLQIEGGSSKMTINGETTQLIASKYKLKNQKINLSKTISGDNASIKLLFNDKEEADGISFGDKINLSLHPNTLWNLDVDFGAGILNYDFTKIKLESLRLDIGAASSTITIGEKQKNTEIDITTGLSKIELNIPKKSGCKIEQVSAINQTELKDFIKVKEHWETPNYNTASNKINIRYQGGLAKFKINRI